MVVCAFQMIYAQTKLVKAFEEGYQREDKRTLQEHGSNSSQQQSDYVDLGLPSGTLWKDRNEFLRYSYNKALSEYRNSLPTKEQFKELKNLCTWTWTGNGYKVEGPSGESITLPAEGYAENYCLGLSTMSFFFGDYGYYLSSTPFDIENETIFILFFDSIRVNATGLFDSCYRLSVRLVR